MAFEEENNAVVQLGDWKIVTDNESDGQYIYITRDGQPGEIHVKAEAEGFVVDIYAKDGIESLATAAITYSELQEDEEEGHD